MGQDSGHVLEHHHGGEDGLHEAQDTTVGDAGSSSCSEVFAAGSCSGVGEVSAGEAGADHVYGRQAQRVHGPHIGFYLEGTYHFLHGAIKALPQSAFTGVLRYDYLDRDQNVDGFDQTRITFGVNFRPTEDTVFKNDLMLDRARSSGASDWSGTETAYRFSVATYF